MDRETYLKRLKEFLVYAVRTGQLPDEIAVDIFNSQKAIYQGKNLKRGVAGDAPYLEQVGVDDLNWKQFGIQSKQAIKDYDLEQRKQALSERNVAVAEQRIQQEQKQYDEFLVKTYQDTLNERLRGRFAESEALKSPVSRYPEQLRSMRLSSSETDYDRERAAEAQAYDVWEQLRQGQLQQMRSPRSWIQKWMLEHTPNPYYGAKFGISDNAATLQNEREILASLEESRSWANAHPPAIPNSAYAAEIQNLDTQLEAARASMQQREESVAKAQVEMAAGGGGGSRLPPPATPPATPDWLSLLTGLKAGESVKKTNVPTPSAQQWERLNPSQQQQFAGFLDWTKINFEDVLANMQRGRPSTPYGAGSSRFTPIRQR